MTAIAKAERACKAACARGLAASRAYDAAILASWGTAPGSPERAACHKAALALDAANERTAIARLNVCLAERA